MIYGGKDLWNRCVLSLEWKREEVMDGVNEWAIVGEEIMTRRSAVLIPCQRVTDR